MIPRAMQATLDFMVGDEFSKAKAFAALACTGIKRRIGTFF